MAISHIQFDGKNASTGVTHGVMLRQALSQLDEGRANLVKVRDVMTLMIDGDGSNATQFDEVVTRFGFSAAVGLTANQQAKAAWDELNSALSKITTDASVSSVQSALNQVFKKLL